MCCVVKRTRLVKTRQVDFMIDFAVPRMSTTQQPTICSVAKMCPFQSSLPLFSSTLFYEALRAHVMNFEMRRRHHDIRTSTVTRSDSRHWYSICVRVYEVCLCVCSLSILVTRLDSASFAVNPRLCVNRGGVLESANDVRSVTESYHE